jgi:PST family polysaccharide transporter
MTEATALPPPPADAAASAATWAPLRRASANGVVINLGSQVVRLTIQLVYQVALARCLAPQDFGVVAMAWPVLAFVSLFADFGLTQATVQRQDITQAELSFIYWANGSAGLLFAVATIAVSPLVARFYGVAEAGPVTAALGALFLVNGLFSQHLALLNRRLAFARLAAVDLAGAAFGAIAGLAAASAGAGFWAIVIGQAATSVVSAPLAWVLTRWRPDAPRRIAGARRLVAFGADMTAYGFMNYFARNLDNVLIGRFLGETPLGLYDRAYKLLLLPLTQITVPFGKVALPLLARTRDQPERYRRAYLRMLEIIMALTYPGVVFAVCASHELILVALGPRWIDVAPIFAMLGLGALLAPISYSTGWLFITQERTREMRNWGFASSVGYVLSFIVGLPWGPLGVAASYIAVGALQAPVLWRLATRSGPVGLRDLIMTVAPCIAAAGVAAAETLSLQRLLPPGIVALAVMMVAAYVTFAIALACAPSGRAILRETLGESLRLARSLRTA